MPFSNERERTIFLVNPRSPSIRPVFWGRSLGIPTGLGVVGSMAERVRDDSGFQHEIDIKLVDEDLRQRADPQKGDLVLVTSFSLTAKRVQTLIREVNDQGAFVVTGGVHATFSLDDFSQKGAINFRGEAGNSLVFINLIRQWLKTGELERGQNVVSEGFADPKLINLVGLPVSRTIYQQLDNQSLVYTTFATVGCPRKCGFCTVMAGGVVRKRPVEEVIEEIRLRDLDKRGFTLADSDLGAGGRKYVYRFLEELARLKIRQAWSTEITIDAVDRGGTELLDALAKAQCHRLFIGIESPNAENLRSVGKKHNLKYDQKYIQGLVRRAHRRGIKITGLFVIGFLPETVDTIRDIEQYIDDTELDDANIAILTPLPGADIWDEFAASGLFDPQTMDTNKLDTRQLVFKHPLGNDILMKEYERLCRRVYSTPAVISRSTRAFFMSIDQHLPASLKRAFRNSFGTQLVTAEAHTGAHLFNFANKVYDTWRRLSEAKN